MHHNHKIPKIQAYQNELIRENSIEQKLSELKKFPHPTKYIIKKHHSQVRLTKNIEWNGNEVKTNQWKGEVIEGWNNMSGKNDRKKDELEVNKFEPSKTVRQIFGSTPINQLQFPLKRSPSTNKLFSTYSHFYSKSGKRKCGQNVQNVQEMDPIERLTFLTSDGQHHPQDALASHQGNFPGRDSQALMRKNSLFLLNGLKAKYKSKIHDHPHIGEYPNSANQLRIGTFNDKKIMQNTNYINRFQYMEKAKQQILREKLQILNQKVIQMKIKTPLITPEPW